MRKIILAFVAVALSGCASNMTPEQKAAFLQAYYAHQAAQPTPVLVQPPPTVALRPMNKPVNCITNYVEGTAYTYCY